MVCWFSFLASFWLSETGQIWGPWQFSSECMGGIDWNLTCWCILTTFSTAYISVMVCWFSLFWQEFDLVKQVIFAVFRHFLENAYEDLAELICWYSKKWKRQISAYLNYPVTQYPWLLCSQTFLVRIWQPERWRRQLNQQLCLLEAGTIFKWIVLQITVRISDFLPLPFTPR